MNRRKDRGLITEDVKVDHAYRERRDVERNRK